MLQNRGRVVHGPYEPESAGLESEGIRIKERLLRKTPHGLFMDKSPLDSSPRPSEQNNSQCAVLR